MVNFFNKYYENSTTSYWLPKNTTTNVSIVLISALTTIKTLIDNFSNKCYVIHQSFRQLKSVQVPFSTIDIYDFSTLYITLPHELIKGMF